MGYETLIIQQQQKRATNNEVKVLITKWQMMNFLFLKKINF